MKNAFFRAIRSTVREVSEMTRAGQGRYTAELLSPWPINKKQGVLDPFQQEGFAYLTQHRDGIFSIEAINEPALQGFGYDAATVAGKPITLLIAEPDLVARYGPTAAGSRPTRDFRESLSIHRAAGDQRLLVTMPDLHEMRPVN